MPFGPHLHLDGGKDGPQPGLFDVAVHLDLRQVERGLRCRSARSVNRRPARREEVDDGVAGPVGVAGVEPLEGGDDEVVGVFHGAAKEGAPDGPAFGGPQRPFGLFEGDAVVLAAQPQEQGDEDAKLESFHDSAVEPPDGRGHVELGEVLEGVGVPAELFQEPFGGGGVGEVGLGVGPEVGEHLVGGDVVRVRMVSQYWRNRSMRDRKSRPGYLLAPPFLVEVQPVAVGPGVHVGAELLDLLEQVVLDEVGLSSAVPRSLRVSKMSWSSSEPDRSMATTCSRFCSVSDSVVEPSAHLVWSGAVMGQLDISTRKKSCALVMRASGSAGGGVTASSMACSKAARSTRTATA